MATKKTQKNSQEYYCKICDFITSNKNDFNRHLTTQKHIRNGLATYSNILSTEKTPNAFKCDECQKLYQDRSGLWRHKKKCIQN